MFGFYYAAFVTIFLLSDAPGAVGGVRATPGYTENTTTSLPRLAECGKKQQLQIVKAVVGQQKTPLNTSILIAIYNAADEVTDGQVQNAKRKLRQIEKRLGENVTVRYFCVSGDVDAVNPCSQSGTVNWTSKRSVLLRNDVYPECSRRCTLKLLRPTGTHYIAWNVLVHQTQSSSFKAVYRTNEGNDCLDAMFHNGSTSGATLHLHFSWKSNLNLTRLWFSFGGENFSITCQDLKDGTVPTCPRKSTTSVATTTTSKSVAASSMSSGTNRTSQTTPSDNLTEIITVVVPVAGVVIIAIIVAVAVYQVKKQSQGAVRQMHPGTSQSAAQFEPSPPTAGGAFMFHRYSVIQVPPPPETGTADPKEDAEKDNRKRTAYCHCADDYEEWDFQKIARERAAIQNNM